MANLRFRGRRQGEFRIMRMVRVVPGVESVRPEVGGIDTRGLRR